MTDLEKKNYYNILFGYYGVLLTEKQQALFEEYYGEDFSLSEIASEYNISRNAVHDTIKKVQASLDEFEEKLGLYKKDKKLDNILQIMLVVFLLIIRHSIQIRYYSSFSFLNQSLFILHE